jgi:peptidoglycan hydrolase CwlO-like protein
MMRVLIKNIKTMSQKNKKQSRSKFLFNRSIRVKFLVLFSCFAVGAIVTPIVYADQFNQQIQQLQTQNSQAESAVNTLQSQASSYQDAINILQSQISSLQSNIDANVAQQAQIQAQILANQAELAKDKGVLGDDVKAMYVAGQLTTVEELATSKSLSDFVDADTYRNAVESEIETTLTTISQLQDQLQTQQTTVTNLLQSQQSQQAQLDSAQSQQQQLLSYNQAQQATYTQQIQTNDAQISQLHQEEIAANQSGVEGFSTGGGPCGGSASATYNGVTYTYANNYPGNLCNIPQDYVVDQWHMYNRECVSYTAWMESQRSSIANTLLTEYAFGNATNWPANAVKYGAQDGVTVSSTPQVGDVAIRPAIPGLTVDGESDVGHAMYVQDVIDSTTIVVSEYNEDLNGDYSVQVRSTDAPYNGYQDNLEFIHFPSN